MSAPKLTVQLVQDRLLKEEEVKKASFAKLKLRNKGTKEVAKPTAGLDRSKRFDNVTQIVQDKGFTADVAPKNTGDLIPTADFAEKYTDSMPHGQAGGYGKGENQKSPKTTSAKSMNPNQETNLKEVPGGYAAGVKGTEDDGEQKPFQIPQADYAEKYTDSMPHGSKNLKAGNEAGGEAVKVKNSPTIPGGPTRGGGERKAKLGDRTAGAKDADAQKVKQITGPGKEGAKKDAFKWGDQMGAKKETGGATNVVECGVVVKLKGRQKAVFEVVSHKALQRMTEAYSNHGYEIEFERTDDVAWKKDKTFLGLLRESINAKWNFAPRIAKECRKVALQRFGHLVKESYNVIYEDRQEFLNTVWSAFKKIEEMAEAKYIDALEPYEAIVRVRVDGELVDIPAITEANSHAMAARQVRNEVLKEYGLELPITMIKVDAKVFKPEQIVEYKVRNSKVLTARG